MWLQVITRRGSPGYHFISPCILIVNHVAGDVDCDLDIDPDNTQQYIVWAVGGLGETAFRHFSRSAGT